MAIQELDELFGRLTVPEDRTVLEQIFARNEAAREYATEGTNLYRAFVDGDRETIAKLEAKEKARTRTEPAARTLPTPSPSPAATLNADEIYNMVAAKVRADIAAELKAQTTQDYFKGIVKTTADELAPGMYATSTRNADELYTVRRSHEREFGKELDTVAFNKFIEDNKGKFADLPKAHDAFMAEERIQVRIAKGIEEGEVARAAAKATSAVPGSTFSSSPVAMARKFMDVNKTPAEATRGAHLDQAAQAFRKMNIARAE